MNPVTVFLNAIEDDNREHLNISRGRYPIAAVDELLQVDDEISHFLKT